jgi:branched-chain amino acid aminotransferase
MRATSERERLARAGLALTPAVWVNGERQGLSDPHVSATDRGFTLADGVFETMFARQGRVFRLEDHIARLERGLVALSIPVPPLAREWVMRAASEANAVAGIRLTVTRGSGPGGLAPPADAAPTVVVTVGPLPSPPVVAPPDAESEELLIGCAAHVASGRRNERSITAGLKTLAYTDSVAALLEARRAGANEALFLDTEGHCSEAAASNLFIWTGQELLTPPVSCGALPGITRAAVMQVAEAAGLPVAERACGLDELTGAAEAFLTSSMRGVVPLLRIGNQWVGGGRPGVRTQELAAAYEALVTRECGA